MKIQSHLLFSLTHLSPLAYRLFLFLYSLKREQSEVKTDLPSIRQALGLVDKNQNNKNVFEAIEELKEWITLRDFRTLKAEYESSSFPLFADVSVLKKWKYALVFTLSPKVLEIEKSGSFTPLSQGYLAKLKGIYTLKLFMLIFSHRKLVQRKLHLSHEKLCAVLGMDPELRPSEIVRRLMPALVEIQAASTPIVGFMPEYDRRQQIWIVSWDYEAVKQERPEPKQRDKTDWKNLKFNEFVSLIRAMALIQTIKIPVANGVLGVDRKGHLYNVNTGETFDKTKAGQLWCRLYQDRGKVQKILQSYAKAITTSLS